MKLFIFSLLLLTGCYTIEKDDLFFLIKISYEAGCTDNSDKSKEECNQLAIKFSEKAKKILEERR